MKRTWDVLLLCGASGVGKSCVSYRLAHKYEVGITEIDDFQVILENMTTEKEYPEVHYWNNHFDEAVKLSEMEKLEVLIKYSITMSTAIELVIGNHLESDRPVVLEGDFIDPSLGTKFSYGNIPAQGKVKAVLITEDDENQIVENYYAREGERQQMRARTSWLHNNWLKEQAKKNNIPIIESRPWNTVLQRISDKLEE